MLMEKHIPLRAKGTTGLSIQGQCVSSEHSQVNVNSITQYLKHGKVPTGVGLVMEVKADALPGCHAVPLKVLVLYFVQK